MSTYYFIPSKLDGNVIDIVGNNTAAGTLLDAYPQKATGNANQLWEFVPDPAGSGYYFIKSQLDGSVIDVQGNSLAPGTALDAWPQKPTGNANQLWEFVPDPAGSGYSFIVSRLNGYVIDVSGASTAAGAQLDAYPLKVTGTDNQLWKVLGGSFPTSVPAAPAPSEGLGSNYNYLLNSNCNWLTGVSVTVDVFQDITGSDGFGFQLNAYSATSDYDAAQQYLIYLDPHSQPAQLYCMVDNWTVQGGQSQIINNIVPLATLPSHTLPAGYQLLISLANGVPPAAGSALDGYWGSDSSQHVNFIGTDGHVHELYIHPGASWVNNDLTVMSGDGVAPAAGSALDGYWGSDSSQHVNFIGTDGHVHELYIHPGASWVNNDLTVMSGNGVAPAVGSALDGYWGSDSSQHVNFVGTDGHLHELYIHPGASWVNNDLTVMSGNGVAPAVGSALDGYWGSDSSQHVNFIGTDGHVHELYIHPGAASWANNDLIQMSGNGIRPAAGSALDGYWGSDSSQHVNFIGTDGHVHELYIHPGAASWANNDLTQMSGNGIAPAVGSKLDGYWGSDSSQHVNFIGIDGHVHELYIHPGAASWANNDLTQLSGNGVAPAMGSRLDGYWGTDSSQHVNFIGIDGDVHELYIHPGASWANNDLTQMSGGAGVTSATYTVLDNTGKTIGNQTMTLLSLSGVTSNDVAPIVAFQVDFVDYLNGGNTVLSSGAGTITYTASNPLTALSAPPACVDWNYITLETANSSYSVLPSNASTTLTQSFQTSAGRVTGVKPKFGTVLHTTSRRAPAAKT
jgi:Ricin-type beta-trefoil lectin domain-like